MFKKILLLTFLMTFIFASPPTPPTCPLPWEGDSCLTPGMNVHNYTYSYYSNWATHTPNNRVYGVWYRGNNLIIMRWWDQVGSWSPEETISIGNISFTFAAHPSISGDSNNNIHFVWRGRPTTPTYWWIFYRAKLVNGSYTNICSLPTKSAGAIGYPKIAAGKGDTAHTVFYVSWGGGFRIAYVKIYPSYPTPQVIDIDTISPMEWTGSSSYAHIAVDGQNRIHIVWYGTIPIGSSNFNVFYRMRDANGLWSQVETLSLEIANTCNSLHPRVAVDGNGNIHVVWYAYNFVRGECSHIAHRIKTSSGWSEITLIPTAPNYYFYYPTCAVDPNNDLHIAYYTDSSDYSIYKNIYRLIRRANGNWEGPDTVTFFSEGSRFCPEIVATPDGNIHIFRMDQAPYTNNYYWIYYKRHIPLLNDIGVKEIIEPIDSVPRLTITPKIIVKNYGLSSATNFISFFRIYNETGVLVYNQEKLVVYLSPQRETLLIYPSWLPETVGNYQAVGIVYWSSDENRRNDTLRENFFIYWKDVGISEIIQPIGNYPKGIKLQPKCKIKNFGSFEENNICVRCSIPDINYYQLETIPSLSPYQELIVTFSESIAVTSDTNEVFFIATTEGDLNPENDILSGTYFGSCIDFLINPLSPPAGRVLLDTSHKPVSCRVKNCSGFEWEGLAFAKIYKNENLIYFDSAFVNIPPGGEVILNFTSYPWAREAGEFKVVMRVAEDSVVYWFMVTFPPIGWSRKSDVTGATKPVKSGGALCALGKKVYALVGNNTRDLMIYDVEAKNWTKASDVPEGPKKKNVKKGASMCTDGQYIYVAKGNNTQEFAKFNPANGEWKEYQVGFSKGIKGSSMAYDGDSFIYIICGSNNNEWKRFNRYTENFEPCNPASLPADRWKTGSWIVYAGDAIYGLRVGGKENEFYRIPIGSTGERKTDMPMIGSTGKKKKAKEGSAGAYNPENGLIYALKGGNTLEFFSYNPVNDQWTILENVGEPEGRPAKRVKGGGSLSYSPAAGGLFAFVGNNTNEFWFYVPGGKFWASAKPSGNIGVQAETKNLNNFTLTIIPTRDYLKVSYTLSINIKATLKIYDAIGNLVYNATSDKGYFVIDTKRLATGIYIMKFAANEYKATKKLVIH